MQNTISNTLKTGFLVADFHAASVLTPHVRAEDWKSLDFIVQQLVQPGGELFQFLLQYHDFQSIEFIISIRDSRNEYEEDGIWHDDGGRFFAFSLSLTENANAIEGGVLGIRKKGETDFVSIPTPEFGKIILFQTGQQGYEHKIHRVAQGRRIVIAGWCS